MNHDILHCDGLNCKLRDNFHRYLAHLEVQKIHALHISYDYIVSKYNSNTKKCKNLWKEKQLKR